MPEAQLRPEMVGSKLLEQVAQMHLELAVRLRLGLEALLHPVPEARTSRGPGVRQRQVAVLHWVAQVERLPA